MRGSNVFILWLIVGLLMYGAIALVVTLVR